MIRFPLSEFRAAYQVLIPGFTGVRIPFQMHPHEVALLYKANRFEPGYHILLVFKNVSGGGFVFH